MCPIRVKSVTNLCVRATNLCLSVTNLCVRVPTLCLSVTSYLLLLIKSSYGIGTVKLHDADHGTINYRFFFTERPLSGTVVQGGE